MESALLDLGGPERNCPIPSAMISTCCVSISYFATLDCLEMFEVRTFNLITKNHYRCGVCGVINYDFGDTIVVLRTSRELSKNTKINDDPFILLCMLKIESRFWVLKYDINKWSILLLQVHMQHTDD